MRNILLLSFLITGACHNSSAQVLLPTDTVPVRVAYFSANEEINTTKLNWKVVCFLDFANFEIQRSSNGSDYNTINSFTADRIRCLSPFEFDASSSSGRTYYRLKVGDKDGNFSTSKVIVAYGKTRGFDITAMAPTLVRSTTQLSISSATTDRVMIYISNMQGSNIMTQTYSLLKGNNTISLNLSTLPKGAFILSAYNTEGDIKTMQFIKD